MTKPRLGVAIIIDNISTKGYGVDVTTLKNAYKTVGFEVHAYNNCNLEVRYHPFEQPLICLQSINLASPKSYTEMLCRPMSIKAWTFITEIQRH